VSKNHTDLFMGISDEIRITLNSVREITWAEAQGNRCAIFEDAVVIVGNAQIAQLERSSFPMLAQYRHIQRFKLLQVKNINS
jgi:precorrin isomerase